MKTSHAVVVCALLVTPAAAALEISETDAAITVREGAKTVLVYHKAEVPPPEGADPVYARSGFIHPLCAPSGQPVTGIHPDDHIHHLGLWHAWVKTAHGDRKPDFWNLRSRTGRVRYKDTVAVEKKGGAVGFTVRQEHVSLDAGKAPVVVLLERFSVTVSSAGDGYAVDYTTAQTNTSSQALVLPAYRYGGPIAYRGPAHWDKSNSKLLTSEGKTRTDGHTTRGRWCAFSGPVEGGQACLAILCHPKNHDAPQRMRIWPPDTHHGMVFFNYVPIQESGWQIASGDTSIMRYRLVVSDTGIDADAINKHWEAFAKD